MTGAVPNDGMAQERLPFRWRSVAAGLAIVFGLAGYAVLVTTLSLWVPDHWAAELAFFVAAGLLWIWPAGGLIRWAAREQRDG